MCTIVTAMPRFWCMLYVLSQLHNLVCEMENDIVSCHFGDFIFVFSVFGKILEKGNLFGAIGFIFIYLTVFRRNCYR